MPIISLKNNTKKTSKIGYAVKIDSNSPDSFIYAGLTDTNITGIVMEAVPYRQQCKIAIPPSQAVVFVADRVNHGDVIRLSKASDIVSQGACRVVKTGDSAYLRIGEALQSGKGLIKVNFSFAYIGSLDNDTTIVDWHNVGKPPTRIVTATTTELTTDYTIVCNRATAMTVNLLPATGSGRIIQIANINLGEVTADCNGTDTIDGETTQPIGQWETMDIQDYASGKFKII